MEGVRGVQRDFLATGPSIDRSRAPRFALRAFVISNSRLVQTFTTAKTQMIIRMAPLIHYAGSVPERRTPAAPVLMSPVRIKNEPATFHLRVT